MIELARRVDRRKKPETSTNDLARRLIAARGYLSVDEASKLRRQRHSQWVAGRHIWPSVSVSEGY